MCSPTNNWRQKRYYFVYIPIPIICIDIQYNTIPEGICPCFILTLNESND